MNLHARGALEALEKLDQFCAAVHVELLVDMPNMGTNRSRREHEFLYNRFCSVARGSQREDLGLARGEAEFLGNRGNSFIHGWRRFFRIGLAGFHIEFALFNWLKYERVVAVGKHEACDNDKYHYRAYAERHHHRRECKSGDFAERHARMYGAPSNGENQKRRKPQGQDGDGHLMAEQTAHGRANHLTVDSLFNNVKDFSYDSALGVCVAMQPSNFWVNQDGLRFMNENISSTAVSGKVVETQGSVWSIVDADGIQKYAEGGCQRHYSGFADKLVGNAIDGLQDEVDKAVSGNDECFKADTIADLAKKIGVDADNLADEIEKYNTGTDAEWGKESENMWPIATAPFYAFRISSGMLNTSGGIRINTNAQVVDDRYKPIAGLYAAGVCTSGWDGEVYGNGTCQANALFCGRTAAKHIVKNLL